MPRGRASDLMGAAGAGPLRTRSGKDRKQPKGWQQRQRLVTLLLILILQMASMLRRPKQMQHQQMDHGTQRPLSAK